MHHNLIHRLVLSDEKCPLCDFPIEDTIHILVKCPVAIRALSCCGVDLSSFNVANWGVSDLFGFIGGLKKECKELLFVSLWKIWCNRNSFVFEGKDRYSKSIAELVVNFMQWHRMPNSPICLAAISQTRWQAPPPHWFKVNFDAALFEKIRSMI